MFVLFSVYALARPFYLYFLKESIGFFFFGLKNLLACILFIMLAGALKIEVYNVTLHIP